MQLTKERFKTAVSLGVSIEAFKHFAYFVEITSLNVVNKPALDPIRHILRTAPIINRAWQNSDQFGKLFFREIGALKQAIKLFFIHTVAFHTYLIMQLYQKLFK